MKNKLLIGTLTLVLIFSFLGSSLAAELQTVELKYETTDKEERKDDAFEQERKIDGKTYVLQDITYTVLDKEQILEKKEVKRSFATEPGEEPRQTIEEDGIAYTLLENQDANTTYVTTYTDYDRAVTRAQVPQSKTYGVETSSGNTIDVECELVNVTVRPTPTIETTYIDIVFESYNARYFYWQDLKVSKDTNEPLKGYERQLLASVGASESNHKVLSTAWNGGEYTDENGVLCRNARATVQRSVYYNRANYAAEVNLNDEYEYQAIVEMPVEGEYNYTMLATATYEQKSNAAVVITVIGIAVLILLVVLLLWAIGRKRKEKQVDDGD